MVRISKPPEVRKKEILDTAMKLFYAKGYEETSMADIAREMNVVPGLCYRYFKSKQELFDISMDQYAKECGKKFLKVMIDDKKSLHERIDNMAKLMMAQEGVSEYHDFYHKIGNEMLHEQLMIKITQYLIPKVCEEFQKLSKKGEVHIENIESVVSFIMYGQIGVLSCNIPLENKVKQIRGFINSILGI